MIEEIPWLWELKIHLAFENGLALSPDVYLSLMPGGAKRPDY
jgi:hypothetical protein